MARLRLAWSTGLGGVAVGTLALGCQPTKLLPTAVSPSLGPTGQVTIERGGRGSVGAASSFIGHWSRRGVPASGWLFGLEHEGAFVVGPDRPEPVDRYRFALLGGYGWEPLQYRPRLGFQAMVAGGYGRFPTLGEPDAEQAAAGLTEVRATRHAVYVGARAALPYRLSKRRQLWDAENLVSAPFMIVPWFGAGGVFPTSRADPRLTLEGGAALRFTIWTAVAP